MSVGRSLEEAEASPDPSWRGLYVTGALGIISAFGIIVRPIAVPPPLGIGYIVYTFFLTIWFVAVGLKLYRLG